jgi:hypothetical protein
LKGLVEPKDARTQAHPAVVVNEYYLKPTMAAAEEKDAK